jgi:hypothetical protein
MPTLELPSEFDSITAQLNMHDVDVYFNSIHTFLPISQSTLQHLLCCSWQQHVRLLYNSLEITTVSRAVCSTKLSKTRHSAPFDDHATAYPVSRQFKLTEP